MISIDRYNYNDVEAMFSALKDLLKPKKTGSKNFGDGYTEEDDYEFRLIGQWLNLKGYYLKQFPNAFKNKWSIFEFGGNQIKLAIQRERNDSTSKVKWAERKEFIEKFELIASSSENGVVDLSTSMNELIQSISTRHSRFEHMEQDEKLTNLNNVIEFILKPNRNSKFLPIDEQIFFGFLSEENVKKFREDTQIFRHANAEAILERSQWNNEKKKFYIGLGTLIVSSLEIK